MSISRRKNGSWLVDIQVDGRRKQKTLPRATLKRDVEAFARKLRTELADPGSRHASTTVRDLITRYWNEKGSQLASAGHVNARLGMWGEALGLDTPLARVDAAHVSAIVGRWRREWSPATCNRRLAALSAAWNWASDVWGMPLERVPWRRLRQAEPEPMDRSVGHEAREALLAAWPARSRAVAELSLATGLRRGAVLRLERRDIDPARGVIHTKTKGRAGGKEVVVPITEALAAILAGMDLPEVGRLFQIRLHEIRRDRELARRAAALPSFRFHDLRHCFAQDLEDAGVGHLITPALHHSSASLRPRYAKARMAIGDVTSA